MYRPGPTTIHHYAPNRNDAKKATASANSAYSESPVKVRIPMRTKATAPINAHRAVIIYYYTEIRGIDISLAAGGKRTSYEKALGELPEKDSNLH